MGMQAIPFGLAARTLAVSAALVLLTGSGCVGSNEVIANRKIMGQVTVTADNSTPGGPRFVDGVVKPVPVIESVKKDASSATGRVGDWNSITLRGIANQGPQPKPAPANPAPARVEFAATAVETSEFSLRQNGRQVDMKVDLTWNAAISQGKGSIAVDVTIAGPGFCNLKGKFDLVTDPKDPSNQTIDVTGYRTFKMKNGGSSDDKGVVSGARCVLKAGDYTLKWSVAAQAAGEGLAEINIHRAILSLNK